jgi:hypothetical protein
MRSALTALPAGLGGALAIVREVPAAVLATGVLAIRVLSTRAAGLRGPLTVIGEVTAAALTAFAPGFGRFLAVFGEVSGVAAVLAHVGFSF